MGQSRAGGVATKRGRWDGCEPFGSRHTLCPLAVAGSVIQEINDHEHNRRNTQQPADQILTHGLPPLSVSAIPTRFSERLGLPHCRQEPLIAADGERLTKVPQALCTLAHAGLRSMTTALCVDLRCVRYRTDWRPSLVHRSATG